jgi:predicted HD phosphohydrolase
MDKRIAEVASAMMRRNSGDLRRIEHSLKVFAYAHQLGIAESLDDMTNMILQLTALLHDIGIHVAEKKYGRSTSHDQEVEGPPVAREILTTLDFEPEVVERVTYIISRHHTLSAIDNIDFQLLVEADFLVNSSEDQMSDIQITNFARNVFKSESGLSCLSLVYPHQNFEVRETRLIASPE